MKIEGRKGGSKCLVLLPENEEESKMIDEYLSAKIPSKVTGTIDLADGYGQHYIKLTYEENPG